MAVKTKTVKDGSHGARVLDALSDLNWHSTSDLGRRCGEIVIHSAVSNLRKSGYRIEHRLLKGKSRASLANQYRLVDPPLPLPSPGTDKLPTRTILDRDAIPRTKAHKYRIYRVIAGELELVATARGPNSLGRKIIELGIKNEFQQSCLGLLETFGQSGTPGMWLVSPWDTEVV